MNTYLINTDSATVVGRYTDLQAAEAAAVALDLAGYTFVDEDKAYAAIYAKHLTREEWRKVAASVGIEIHGNRTKAEIFERVLTAAQTWDFTPEPAPKKETQPKVVKYKKPSRKTILRARLEAGDTVCISDYPDWPKGAVSHTITCLRHKDACGHGLAPLVVDKIEAGGWVLASLG